MVQALLALGVAPGLETGGVQVVLRACAETGGNQGGGRRFLHADAADFHCFSLWPCIPKSYYLEVLGLLSRRSLVRRPAFLIRLALEIPGIIHHKFEVAVIICLERTNGGGNVVVVLVEFVHCHAFVASRAAYLCEGYENAVVHFERV